MKRKIVVAIVVCAGFVACAGAQSEPSAQGTKTTTTATTSAAKTTPSSSTSVAASASASASVCLPNDPDVVGYDELTDFITLCAKTDCVVLARDRPPVKTTPPVAPLTAAFLPFEAGMQPGADTNVAVAPTRVKISTARWANVPFAASKYAELLWLSKDGKRALVVRYVGPSGALEREHFDLVDFATHASLAHAELCNYVIHTEAEVDDAETILMTADGHDNPIVISSLIDLVHAKFIVLGPKTSNGYGSCPGPDDTGRFFLDDGELGLFDLHRRRVGRTLVDLEGNIVARLDGDFPDGPQQQGVGRPDALMRIDDDRRVVVRFPAWIEGTSICAGAMRAVAATSADGPPIDPPRCVPRCGTKPSML
jgi:hypothetical protein